MAVYLTIAFPIVVLKQVGLQDEKGTERLIHWAQEAQCLWPVILSEVPENVFFKIRRNKTNKMFYYIILIYLHLDLHGHKT